MTCWQMKNYTNLRFFINFEIEANAEQYTICLQVIFRARILRL